MVGAATLASQQAEAKDPVHAQLDELAEMAKGKRLGVLTNGSARTKDGLHNVDYLLQRAGDGTTVTAFFGPEHGFRGDIMDGKKLDDGTDPKTGVPVYSLYGKRTAPTDEQLKDVDLFVFDIPDIGARFYTYTWTMTHTLESCAKNNIPFVIIDRPNPITGTKVEGAVNEKDLGLVGRLGKGAEFGIPTRHGMTTGEIATMWNKEWMDPKVDLTVITAKDWSRDQWWDELNRDFIAPSPNMRTLDCATVYPGTCIFEGARTVNEGRGTTAPFELIGAPYVDGQAWASKLNDLKLPGVNFLPAEFTPDSRRFANEKCGGVQIVVTDRDVFEPVRTGVHMLQTLVQLYPDKVEMTDYVDQLMASPGLRERIRTENADDIVKSWDEGRAKFLELRKKHLLYPVKSAE